MEGSEGGMMGKLNGDWLPSCPHLNCSHCSVWNDDKGDLHNILIIPGHF